MENPFPYGRVVMGRDFADRKDELGGLVREMKAGGRVFLISPRRYGKTSLVVSALAKLRDAGLLTAYLDLYDVTTVEQFAAHYARAVARASETRTEGIISFIRAVIPALRPKITINPEGEISVGVDAASDKPELSLLLKDVLDAPARIAERKGRKFVVAFDEFQEAREIGGTMLERMMRASFQQQPAVGYLFSGSKQHAMADMVRNRTRPFYNMGALRFLGKIPEPEMTEFICGKFASTGRRVARGAAAAILGTSRGIPYYVLHLCHELWEQGAAGGVITAELVPRAVAAITEKMSPLFLSAWDSMTLGQRHLARAIAVSGGKRVFSNGFIRGNQLGSASAVQKALKLLVKKAVLEKEDGEIRFSDLWFGEWVRRRMS